MLIQHNNESLSDKIAYQKLKDAFPQWNWSPRVLTWLWLVLEAKGSRLSPDEFGVEAMYDEMGDFAYNERLHDLLNDEYQTSMLPEHSLEWIDKNGRQVNWLFYKLKEERNRLPRQYPVKLNVREKFIAAIDYLAIPLSKKEKLIEQLNRSWVRHSAEDKHYDWFKGSQPKLRCEIAWNWYQENYPRRMRETLKFKNLSDVLVFLDTSGFELDEKRFHIEQIKKKFNLNKTKANLDGKKQTNLALREEIREQFDELAKKERMTLVEIAEHLIQHAHRYGMPQKPSEINSTSHDVAAPLPQTGESNPPPEITTYEW